MEWFERIKELRIANGLTQGELGRLVGYTDRSSIAKMEKGLMDLPISKLELFSEVFMVTPSYLLGQKVTTSPYKLNKDKMKLLAEYDQLTAEGQNEIKRHMKLLLKVYNKDGK